jgi:hypothetical protein
MLLNWNTSFFSGKTLNRILLFQAGHKDNLSLATTSAMEMMSSQTGHYHSVTLLEGTTKKKSSESFMLHWLKTDEPDHFKSYWKYRSSILGPAFFSMDIPRTCFAVNLSFGSGSNMCRTRSFALSETLGQGSRLKSIFPRSMACATPCSVSAIFQGQGCDRE